MTPIRLVLSVTFPLTLCLSRLSALHWVFPPQKWTVRICMGSSSVLAASRLSKNNWNGLRLPTFLQHRTIHSKSSLRRAFTRGCATGQLSNNNLGSEYRDVLRHGLSVLRRCHRQRRRVDEFSCTIGSLFEVTSTRG